MPCGKLRISNNRGVPRYYYITEPKDTRGTYMRQEKIELARNLAQKDYIIKLEKEIQSELKDINNYLRKHGSSNLENNYANLNEYRKANNSNIKVVLNKDNFVAAYSIFSLLPSLLIFSIFPASSIIV